MTNTQHGIKRDKATPIKKAAGSLKTTMDTSDEATQIITLTTRIKGMIVRCALWLTVMFPGWAA